MGEHTGALLIIGLPAAGKTTLARHLAACTPGNTQVKVWSLDDFENAGRLRDKNDRIYTQVMEHLDSHINIIDDTMHLDSMRARYFRSCQSRKQGFCLAFCEAPYPTLLARNQARGAGVDDQVIFRMAQTFEPISKSMRRFTISVNDLFSKIPAAETNVMWERVLLTMASFRDATSQPTPKGPAADTEAHAFESFIRKAVSRLIQAASPSERSRVATALLSWKSSQVPILKRTLGHPCESTMAEIESFQTKDLDQLCHTLINRLGLYDAMHR